VAPATTVESPFAEPTESTNPSFNETRPPLVAASPTVKATNPEG
jgi:hypothetical protein